MRLRINKRKLTLCLAAGFMAGTGALVGTPLHAFAASTLTLTASSTTAAAGQTVTLRATASPTPAPEYQIYIYEATTQDVVGNDGCFDENPCVRGASYPTTSTHTFRADLYDNAGNTVTSAPVTVTWTGTATYSVSLVASPPEAEGGQLVWLGSSASPNTPTGYFLDIYEANTRTLIASCYGDSACSGSATHSSGTYTYQAFIDNDPNDEYPPTGAIATSAPVQVTWTPPSLLLCQPPTLPILGGGGIAGFNVTLSVKVSTSQTAVCYRVDNDGGTAVGGAVIVNTSVPGVPHVVNANLCAGATGNTAPGPHPLDSVTVLGVPTFLDVYQGPAAGNDTWICSAVGTTAETVVIPSLSGLPSVQFVRDPDSLI